MSLEFSQERVVGTPDAERARVLADPVFGEVMTDHMVTIKWSRERGWHDARLGAYGPLTLDPTAQVFHYGQEIFEGLKAYRRADGSIVSFRPDANAARLNTSAARMAMPALPEEAFLEALRLLVDADRDWVPTGEGRSLYLRPFMIATQSSLGFYRPSDSYLFVVVAGPAGAYFKGGVEPVSVWLTTDYTRAADGGTGAAKCGGNYAGTLVAQEQAAEHGCDQVVWLDAKERRWVDEMGTSNMFFVYGDRLVTPELTGTLLAGITRDSVLTLARDLGLVAEEGRISVEQWRADAEAGRLTEVFSCGTSSMITPVGRAKSADGEWLMGDGRPGAVTMRLRAELMGIQSGELPDRHGWVHKMA
ncbi:branched-chain amino acid aminotransferase [Streptomyces purpurogeneiscleroticus]|uniref:branched-chain amino acid aminotransferase n=1 Tax=Streptomyces purpurogeneiscleroticus TaxID=68259 RepID=UPI001CBDAEB2|nr:branched-chain amino acid aminotransferase [Streptomyces purpurogeneiscleroticus]MBZ4019514.1 branched chain amino acid aminotransferase [Streptomyces purpurogeneiscleroticus]